MLADLAGFLSVIIGVALLSLLHSRELLAVFLALLALILSSDFNESLDNLLFPPYFSLLADIKLEEDLLLDSDLL